MTNLLPRQRRRARTRQEILDVALELVVERGIDGLSLREIARRVDYSPAGLYEYFDGKDAIVDALASEGYRRLESRLVSVPVDLDPVERLVELGMAYVAFAHDHPEYFQLIFARMPSQRQSLDEPVGESPYGILMAAAQTAIEAGVLDVSVDCDAEQIAYNLWSMVHGMAMLQSAHLCDFEADFETADRNAVRAYLHGLGTQ
jgi:AcrR family transcriptional regulator